MGDRDFGLFMTGQLSTSFGSALTAVVLPVIAVERFAADDWQIGLLHAAAAVPIVLTGFLIGVWSDRRNRKRLCLIWADVLSIVAIAFFCLGIVSDVVNFYWILPVVLFFGVADLAVESLYFAHLQTVIGSRTIIYARSRSVASERLGSSAGSGLAGVLVWLGGHILPLVVDLITFVINTLCLAASRVGRPSPRRRARAV